MTMASGLQQAKGYDGQQTCHRIALGQPVLLYCMIKYSIPISLLLYVIEFSVSH